MNDTGIRIAAVLAAAALLAAPYRAQIQAAASAVLEACRAHGGHLARLAAAGLIVAAAWGKVPMPTLSVPSVPPAVAVDTPSADMQAVVADVGAALRGYSAVDRALWAETWNKAGLVVEGDAVATEVAFTDTRSLRLFTTLTLDIAWRRIGGKVPGSDEKLREAVEAAYVKAMGVATVAVTKETRKQFAEFARAMAWAGVNKG